ncbi:hypothetical protein [Mesorhizobium xinjiangense]|uniref:hypothetical protein n=1 Tax=Mesorhizobium xinjiangense TaxID=2678685 RepID=UPI0012ECC0DE|nr:hypothetical protein [Mesorhizobium xinjiangense]
MHVNRILNTIVAVAGAALLTSAFVTAAEAQRGPCTTRTEVVSWLDERFDERPAGFGLIGDQAVLELFKSADGTWTVIVTDRNKRTCLVAAGDSWVDIEPPAMPVSTDR